MIAAIVTLGTLFIVASIIYQVERGANTPAILGFGNSVITSTESTLFKSS